MNTQQQLAKQLRADGYRFVRAAEMRGLLEQVAATGNAATQFSRLRREGSFVNRLNHISKAATTTR